MNILRISNASEHTSAPLNSFTLARNRFYSDEIITYISFFKNNNEAINLYFLKYRDVESVNRKRLIFQEAHGSIKLFWKLVSKWVKDNRNTNEQSIIHLHQPRSGFIAALAAKFNNYKIPLIYTVHNNFRNYPLKHKIALFLNFLLVDKVTFVSEDAYNSFYFFRLFYNKKSISIQNGVDVERIEKTLESFVPKTKKDTNELKIISTGRFTTQKNQHFLLDILEKYKGDWHLDIYGNGQFKDSLLEEINKKGLTKKVSLKNTIPRDEILQAYSNADIYISTALWEGLPVAVMEAMTVGLPCIVSNIPSHKELGKNLPGVLKTPFDIDEWHKVLDYWINLNNDERISLGLENRKVINKKFTMRIMQQNYRELYENLLQKT